MARRGHGEVEKKATGNALFAKTTSFLSKAGLTESTKHFGYMFPLLQEDNNNFLSTGKQTLDQLRKLASTMADN